MDNFTPGERYPLAAEEAATVLQHGWPAVRGEPDLSRGRRFVGPPASWEFWLTDGRKVTFDYSPGLALVVSASREPDPQRPDPLPGG